jgi:hypothetical protein
MFTVLNAIISRFQIKCFGLLGPSSGELEFGTNTDYSSAEGTAFPPKFSASDDGRVG